MIENISDVIILEGDNLQLHPAVDANPAPVSFWWSRHNDANFRVNGSNLKVNVIQREATANYTFHVMNILTPSGISAINRTSRKTIHIDVQCKFHIFKKRTLYESDNGWPVRTIIFVKYS